MDNLTVVSIANFIIATGTAIGLLYGAGRWLLRQLDRRTATALAIHDAKLDQKLDQKLEPIKTELHTNSGKSLKDHIVRLAEQVTTLQEKDDRRHAQNVEELETQQAQIDELRDSQRIIRRAFAAVLRSTRGDSESRIPFLPDEVLVELDRFDEQAGKYRSTAHNRRRRADS